MPTYEYRCKQCKHEMEEFQSMKDEALVECPECHTPNLVRLISAGTGLIFKGKGFYLTDYKNGTSQATSSGSTKPKDEGSKDERAKDEKSKHEKSNDERPKSDGSKRDAPKTDGAKTESGKSEGAKSESGKSESAASTGSEKGSASTGSTSKSE